MSIADSTWAELFDSIRKSESLTFCCVGRLDPSLPINRCFNGLQPVFGDIVGLEVPERKKEAFPKQRERALNAQEPARTVSHFMPEIPGAASDSRALGYSADNPAGWDQEPAGEKKRSGKGKTIETAGGEKGRVGGKQRGKTTKWGKGERKPERARKTGRARERN